MMKPQVEKAFNEQINKETYSAYLYFSMSAWLGSINLPGFAHWMYTQGLEELTHVQKFYDYIQQRGGTIRLEAIAAPPAAWDSPLALFEKTLAHEVAVTESINQLVKVARENMDHASEIFLQWFVSEQVEEEESVGQVLSRLKMVGDNPPALMMMDAEMGKRPALIASSEEV
ncbi:MAG: ferritin [Desulfobacterales bacterium]|nr:ferritin [Desulfobacterales bacterium]